LFKFTKGIVSIFNTFVGLDGGVTLGIVLGWIQHIINLIDTLRSFYSMVTAATSALEEKIGKL